MRRTRALLAVSLALLLSTVTLVVPWEAAMAEEVTAPQEVTTDQVLPDGQEPSDADAEGFSEDQRDNSGDRSEPSFPDGCSTESPDADSSDEGNLGEGELGNQGGATSSDDTSGKGESSDPEQGNPEQSDPEQSDPEQSDPEQGDPEPVVGLVSDDSGLRYASPDGTYLSSFWLTVDGKTYYFGDDGYAVRFEQDIDGRHYYFSADYSMYIGWIRWADDGRWSYFGPDGAAVSGWVTKGSQTFYLDADDNYRSARNEYTIDGKLYYFTSGGARYTGLLMWPDDGRFSYFGEDGAAVSGWMTIGENRYYFDAADGYRSVRFEKDIDGSLYYFTFDCRMYTGLHKWSSDGRHSYFGEDGAAVSGWLLVDGKWYFFDADNNYRSARSERTIDGNTYYFTYDGVMFTGLHRWSDGRCSYFGSDGAADSGWVAIDSAWYYFDASDSYRSARYERTISGKRYYFNYYGVMQTGWIQWSDGRWSYFGSDGAMYTGTRTIDGVTYTFDSNGRSSIGPLYATMSSKAQGYSSNTSWLIMVDTTNNYVGIFKGSRGNWSLAHFWRCTTGAASTPTVIGQFTVGTKGYSFGYGYTCYYYTQFYGDYLFHSVLYNQGTYVIQDGRLGQNLSHGCVRLSIENAKWIYDNIPYGTKVVTYR